MRLIATADLHFNHARSRPLACELIDQINALHGTDLLLVIGDTATAEGDLLEQCLSRFHFAGPKLFVAGNHELWTIGGDSYRLFTEELPRRVRSAGWHWLQSQPWVQGRFAIVGTIGWYDYSFAHPELGLPRRFYEHKIAPGLAAAPQFAHLLSDEDDIPSAVRQLIARWNDGRFVKIGRRDEQFLDELLAQLQSQLDSLSNTEHILVASHHLPFEQLIPDTMGGQWQFARAFLGSRRLGELLQGYPNIRHVLCGHSHLPAEAQIGHIQAINIGSGYRWKTYREIDLPD